MHSDVPAGTILSWIPKPNSGSNASAQVPDAWILCDGKQKCQEGIFKNEVCQDLRGRALIGADFGREKFLYN